MKIYKITEASDYLGVSINTLKTLANNGRHRLERDPAWKKCAMIMIDIRNTVTLFSEAAYPRR